MQQRSPVVPSWPARIVQPPWLMALIIILFSLILWRFFDMKYLAYVFCILSGLYAVNLLPFLVLATTFAMIALGELVFQSGADDLNTYFYYVISTAWAGMLVMVYLHASAFLMIVFGIIAAVLLKVILLRFEDSLVLEGIGIAMTMYLIQALNYTANIEIVIIAVFIAFVFGYSHSGSRQPIYQGSSQQHLLALFSLFLPNLRGFSSCSRFLSSVQSAPGISLNTRNALVSSRERAGPEGTGTSLQTELLLVLLQSSTAFLSSRSLL